MRPLGWWRLLASESSLVCPEADNIEPNVVPTGIRRVQLTAAIHEGPRRNSGMKQHCSYTVSVYMYEYA